MQCFVQPAIKWCFRNRAVKHVDHFTIFENHNGWDAANTKTGAELTFCLGIHLYKAYFTATLFCNVFENGRKIAARAAPRRPEIDDNREIVLQQFIQRLSVALITSPSNKSSPQRPHFAASLRRSSGMRLSAWQWAQTVFITHLWVIVLQDGNVAGCFYNVTHYQRDCINQQCVLSNGYNSRGLFYEVMAKR